VATLHRHYTVDQEDAVDFLREIEIMKAVSIEEFISLLTKKRKEG